MLAHRSLNKRHLCLTVKRWLHLDVLDANLGRREEICKFQVKCLVVLWIRIEAPVSIIGTSETIFSSLAWASRVFSSSCQLVHFFEWVLRRCCCRAEKRKTVLS